MSTTRGGAHNALLTPVQVTVRPLTAALIALVAALAVAVAIAVAASSGGAGGYTEPVRVAPSTTQPPSAAERNQPPGLAGPGMRP
ncbi:MAG TPA: hypothetical protein VH683_03280 [Thermoleophilaceae bacterium]|jgi:hypothetical protein